MTARPRSAALALVSVLGCLTAVLAAAPGHPPCALDVQAVPAPVVPAAADPTVPVVAVRVRVPARAGTGQELTYHIRVENLSGAAAHHVLLRNPLPQHARFVRATPEPSARQPELVWQLGTLDGGASREVVLVVTPTGTGDVKSCARVQYEHGQCVTTAITRPGISLRRASPTQALLYDALTFQLTVTNTGGTALTDVTLTETLPAGLEYASGKNQLTWKLGTLGPGESRPVEYQVIAKQVGRLCPKAVVTASGGLLDESETCVTVAEPKLELRKTGPAQRYVNLPAAYQLTVLNPGPVPVANVTLTDQLPAQIQLVSATQGGRLVGSHVQWQLGTLPPGGKRTVDVVVRAQTGGEYRLPAVATADRGLKARDEVVTKFEGVAALQLDVTVSDDPVEVGGQTRYRILVRNPGSQPVTQVRIEALAPEQMAVVRAAGPGVDHKKDGQQITYEPLTLRAGGEARYEIQVKALKPGDVRFRVRLTAEQLTAGPVLQEVSTTIYADIPSSFRRDGR